MPKLSPYVKLAAQMMGLGVLILSCVDVQGALITAAVLLFIGGFMALMAAYEN